MTIHQRRRAKEICIVSMFGVFACVTLLLSYWNLEGTLFHKIYDVEDIYYHTTKSYYKQGETVEATVTLCKYRKIAPVIQWSLVDTFLRTYPARLGNAELTGCFEDRSVIIEIIPESVPSDTYYFSGIATFQINPIKRIQVPLRSNTFTVE